MDMDKPIEPNVCRDEIRRLAYEAAEMNQRLHDANPYTPGTQAHLHFEQDYWERDRVLNDEETT